MDASFCEVDDVGGYRCYIDSFRGVGFEESGNGSVDSWSDLSTSYEGCGSNFGAIGSK